MTSRAFPAGLKTKTTMWSLTQQMKARMALKAQLTAFPPNQQHSIGGTVRAMARNASFHFRCRMLMHVGSTLVDMALHAGFGLGLNETGRIQRSVRAMAIRALHQAFGDPVMHRLRELAANRRMARITKVRLGGFQQAACEPSRLVRALRNLEEVRLRRWSISLTRIPGRIYQVSGMTATTRHRRCQMPRMEEQILLLAGLVTAKATF